VTIPAPAVRCRDAGRRRPADDRSGGGCFWGVQAVFSAHQGSGRRRFPVTPAGTSKARNYDMVGTGSTGHAESVAVTFDPQQISYGKILQIYFSVRAQSDRARPAGARCRHQYRLGDLLRR